MEAAKPKILLCEDDTNLGMVLKNYLELNDYEKSTGIRIYIHVAAGN